MTRIPTPVAPRVTPSTRVLASTAEEAVRLLTANRSLPDLSRIVAVTLGAQATEVNWDGLLIEHINRGDVQ